MVLLGGVIEFSIINAHSPTGDRSSRDKLIAFILNNGHALFLGYDLNRTNPITIQNWIDDSALRSLTTSFFTTSCIFGFSRR